MTGMRGCLPSTAAWDGFNRIPPPGSMPALGAQVAFPAFRDTAEEAAPVSLVPYFGDARVTGWLAVHGMQMMGY